MNLVSNPSVTRNLDIMFDCPLVIELNQELTWKRNTLTENAAKYGITEGAEYSIIDAVDTDGEIAKYRISRKTWEKCVSLTKNTVFPAADDRDNIQLILPSQGSSLVLQKLALLKAKRQQSLLQPKGDDSLPF